jgi:hypothetical protein
VLHDGPSPVALAARHAASVDTGAEVTRAPAARDQVSDDVPGLDELIAALGDVGLAAPELESEVSDPRTGEAITVAAAVWPHGLQAEVGVPVVLAVDPTQTEQAALEACGYQVFHTPDALRAYVDRLRSDYVVD